jgi:hypothetical protein
MGKPLVFISCGQYTVEEKRLGGAIADIVARETPYQPYFAEQQNTLEGLVSNILGALEDASALIAVMHYRGTYDTPSGRIQRGSVWVEQEIAMAAFVQHVLKRKIEVVLYIQRGISLEGIRQQLRIGPIEFDKPEDVLDDLLGRVRSWDLKRVEEPRLTASFTVTPRNACHSVLSIVNPTNIAVRAPYFAFRLPANFRVDPYGVDGNGTFGLKEIPVPSEDGTRMRQYADGAAVIYGKTTLAVTAIEYVGNDAQKPEEIDIDYETAGEEATKTSGKIHLDFR